jgi:hypothetical protein
MTVVLENVELSLSWKLLWLRFPPIETRNFQRLVTRSARSEAEMLLRLLWRFPERESVRRDPNTQKFQGSLGAWVGAAVARTRGVGQADPIGQRASGNVERESRRCAGSADCGSRRRCPIDGW